MNFLRIHIENRDIANHKERVRWKVWIKKINNLSKSFVYFARGNMIVINAQNLKVLKTRCWRPLRSFEKTNVILNICSQDTLKPTLWNVLTVNSLVIIQAPAKDLATTLDDKVHPIFNEDLILNSPGSISSNGAKGKGETSKWKHCSWLALIIWDP